MDFTIITPSLNYGRYIGDCLGSVAAQQEVTLEHLVIDGGSTDETPDVTRQFPHALFSQEPDKGMSDAINKGFARAKGQWVMWLNADDRLKPGALKAVKEFVTAHPEADVVYGAWNFIDGSGAFQRTMSLFPFQRRMLLYLGCYIGSTAAFFNRSRVIDRGFLLNINFRYVMDGEYYARLAANGMKFMYLPRILAEFRIHGDNISFRAHGARTVDDCLVLQKQYGEARAIRRAYGATWFSNENWNSAVDAFLQLFFRVWKGFLKLFYRHRLQR